VGHPGGGAGGPRGNRRSRRHHWEPRGSCGEEDGHHRLGFRPGGPDGPVRQPGACGGQDPDQADQRQGQVPVRDQDLRHAEQRRGQGQGLRAQPARPEGQHHLHDLRRRLRDAGRAGGDQSRQARDRAVHRHRPDGAEALRQEGQARLQLRQRRSGRGLGNGGVRVEQALEDGRSGDEHAARLLQERRAGVRHPLPRARRQDRRPRELPDREQRRGDCGLASELAQGRRLRDLDRVRGAPGLRLRAPLAAQQDADPQLVGRRRHLLGHAEPEGDELLLRDIRVGLRGRPRPGGARDDRLAQGRVGLVTAKVLPNIH